MTVTKRQLDQGIVALRERYDDDWLRVKSGGDDIDLQLAANNSKQNDKSFVSLQLAVRATRLPWEQAIEAFLRRHRELMLVTA